VEKAKKLASLLLYLKKLVRKGYDVVVMTEPIDEYVMQVMYQYLGKYKFTNLGKEGVDLDKKQQVKLEQKFKPLSEYLRTVLGDKISKVSISTRLTTTPAVIVAPTYGVSSTMQRIMKNQPLADAQRSKSFLTEKKILEVNPKHPIILSLLDTINEGKQDSVTEDIAKILYESSSLSSGYSLDDPAELTLRVYKLLSRSLGVDENYQHEEEPETDDIPLEGEEIEIEETLNIDDDHIHDHDDL